MPRKRKNKRSKLVVARGLVKLGARKKKELAKRGRRLIALIKAKKDEIARDFYDVGEALVALDDSGMVSALGYESFAALLHVELEMSTAQAARLMNVVKSFPRRIAEDLSASKATAIAELAGAIGGKTTAKGLLARGTVHVPNVGAIDVGSAGAAAIERAARAARAAAPKRDGAHGVHLSSADRALVERARTELRRAKVKSATLEGIAAGATTGGRFRVAGYLHDAKAIGEALVRASRAQPLSSRRREAASHR